MDDFYDRPAPLYDLIFLDWDASMEQQAGNLAEIIRDRWGAGVRTILDIACGIGTQSIGLGVAAYIRMAVLKQIRRDEADMEGGGT
jgi:hypothetical protein